MVTTDIHAGQAVRGIGLRRRLLLSHFSIAVFCLVILLAALISIVWLRSSLIRFTASDLPIREALNSLNSGIQHSDAALTEWVVTGEEICRQDREAAWKNEIRPAMEALHALSKSSHAHNNDSSLQNLDLLLEDLDESEWWVEDVASTPGNTPAEDTSSRILTPIANSIFRDITSMIEEEKVELGSANQETLLGEMADLRGSFTFCWAKLSRFVSNGRPTEKKQLLAQLATSERQVVTLVRRQELLTSSQRQLLATLDDNIQLFAHHANQVITIRCSDHWNVARHHLLFDTIPIAQEIAGEIEEIVAIHSEELERSTERIHYITSGTIVLVVVLGGVLLISTAMISTWNARKLSTPIVALSEAAGALANGTLDSDLPVTGDDEIGYLTLSFNVMRHKLETASVERSKAEATLLESEEKFKSICSSAQDAIIMMDSEGLISFWNDAATKMFGYEREETLGKYLHSQQFIVPDPYRLKFEKAWPEFRKGGQGSAVGVLREVQAIRKNGGSFPAEFSLSGVEIKGKWHSIGILRDIAERKNTEESLKLQSAALESAANAIVISDRKGHITWVNDAFCQLTGYSREEAVGSTTRLLKSGQHDTDFYRDLWKTVLAGNVWSGEMVNRRKDGTLFTEESTITPVADEYGEITHFIAVKQDITERKQLQCDLSQAQKLESVGQLAAGIAHEINTPTQYVTDNTRFLQDAFGDISTVLDSFEKLLQAAKEGAVDEQLVAEVESTLKQADVEYLSEEIPQAIDQSLKGVEQVAKIVRAMKEFSHPGSDSKSLVNLKESIETTISVARNEWKYVAEMVTEFDPELPMVSCLPGELNQVLLNLIVNASHAIGDTLGDEASDKGTITVATRLDGEWAEILVRDTGTGIPEDIRERIFDPFFTTKEVGKGTGQGLSIARSVVVNKHGGTLECESEQGKGTTFIIRIPIDGEQEAQETSELENASSIA